MTLRSLLEFCKANALGFIAAGLVGSPAHAESIAVELHFSICEPSAQALFQKLGGSAGKVKQRNVSYADTRLQENWQNGLTVRTRETTGKKPKLETTVKVKVTDLSKVDKAWFNEPGFKCEYDRYGSTFGLTCSLTEEVSAKSRAQLSQDQIRFAQENGHPAFQANTLADYGPADDTAWKELTLSTSTGDVDLDLQRYVFPDGDQVLEVSTRADLTNADETYLSVQKKLNSLSIQLCAVQASKTRQFFERFSPQF